MSYEIYTLKNGLRVIHKPIESNVSYCGFIINAGTRDEKEDEYGMAHFVEHMLFKGTKKRKSYHIINRMDSLGGELNAYTNKEETVLYSVFLEQHFERAFELLSDMVFNSQFPQPEIDKEIDVIIDEIHSYEDNPSELILDEFENIVFRGSQLGHNILGEEKILETFTTEKAQNFISRYYVPSNMVFFSLGNTDMKKIVRLIEKHLNNISFASWNNSRLLTQDVPPVKTIVEKDTSQAHVMMGGRAYGLHHPQRRALHLLNNILGGTGMNSRLNLSLREKKGYVYSVESNVTTYSDTGLFSIYFGTEKENVNKCIKLVEVELKKLRENKLTTLQLHRAKTQWIGNISIAADHHENLALSLGKSFLHYNYYDNIEQTIQKISAITSKDILEVANEILDLSSLFTLIYR